MCGKYAEHVVGYAHPASYLKDSKKSRVTGENIVADHRKLASAKPWELRAVMNLARLRQSQNKCQDTYGMLTPVYE